MSDIETEARTIVELIRAQDWKNDGALLVGDAEAIALVVTALTVAEQRGVIAGIDRMSAIADKALAPAVAVAS